MPPQTGWSAADQQAPGELAEALRRQRELLARIFDTVPLMMTIYEPTTKVLRVNRAFERLIGWSSDELVTVPLMEKCYPDPEYREQAREYMQACRPEWRDFRVTTRDGSEIESSWTNVRLSDDTQLGIGIDLSERKRAGEELRRSEERFHLVARATNDVIWDVDVRAGTVWWSESLYPLYGHQGSTAEMSLDDWAALIHPDDRERVRAHRTRTLTVKDAPASVEYRFRRGDGSYAHILDRGFVVRDQAGQPIRMVGAMTDITASKATEAALRESEEALRRAHHLKDEFLAMLAHELRNPLASVRNVVEILSDPGAPRTVTDRALTILGRQIGLMVRLVDDLLDIERINTGKFELQRSRVDLAAEVQRAIESSQPLFDGKQQRVFLHASPGLLVDGDPTRLDQVFTNLLHNAVKFTPAGGEVFVSVERDDGQAQVRVRDTGIGIPSEILPRVFDMFVQADRSVDRAHGGLGIGLNLVKRVVDLHGGSVAAASPGVGQGSEFMVRLPLWKSATRQPAGGPERGSDTDAGKVPRRAILVVDDNVDAAATLAYVLSAAGHEVLVAHDGPSALAFARTRPLDAIVMDLGMPGMSGYTAAQLVRADPCLADVLLIALSGWDREQARHQSAQAGFDHHLVKPIDLPLLRALLAAGRGDLRAGSGAEG